MLGEQLFALVDALDSLRLAAPDPGGPVASRRRPRAPLVAQLLDGRRAGASSRPRRASCGRAGRRTRDLADAAEHLAFHALLAVGRGATATLDRVEDELFRLTRALVGQREVRQTLFDDTDPGRRSRRAGRPDPGRPHGSRAPRAIARRAAVAPRGRRYVATLGHIGDLIAERRAAARSRRSRPPRRSRRRSATVSPSILERAYGRAVQINDGARPAGRSVACASRSVRTSSTRPCSPAWRTPADELAS